MTKEQTALDIARRMAELGERSHAVTAYTLAMADARDRQPETELEAALYLFENGGNYKVAYDAFRSLYRRGFQRETLLELMTQAFYQPNIKLLKSRYEKNCRLLRKYPYCFQQDFPAFEELPLRFYPYDDQRYIPFTAETETFGEPLDLRHPVVSRNFFQNLDKPVLAADVYSQYELEYLRDNVRKSEWVGRENHVYLHYTDWGIFCAYLQVLNLRPLLEEEKLVFLIGDEISQYPIDFQARFGMDYSQYPVKPVGIREIHRLIWHTQLSSHNGGDFFNEIFDNHPNLIAVESVMLYHLRDQVEKFRKLLDGGGTITFDSVIGDGDLEKPQRLANQLSRMRDRTDKDIFVALYLAMADLRNLDPAARIVPSIFFQPHFHNYHCTLGANDQNRAVLDSPEYQELRDFSPLKGFKYIKTFTPLRRPTTSTGACVRFMQRQIDEWKPGQEPLTIPDELTGRVLNRNYMVDWQDRLFQDSVLVRFEDGKLNPKATFTALAAFLDLPYTKSMTYCSRNGERDPESLKGNDRGFDPAAIYRTYEEYLGREERVYLEYLMGDVYRRYGYDSQCYDGAPMDEEAMNALVGKLHGCTDLILASYKKAMEHKVFFEGEDPEQRRQEILTEIGENMAAKRREIAGVLMRGLRFVNKNGAPLNFMPLLELDPALLEQPLYH